ncbi:hypothetical protein [Actinomadura sp. NTSP31]|uniref:hypothetical protein n=1 Tax=Actinomadura sp. NTSP31 TaxID=1735447 RepID=UPI0035C10394
MSAQKSTIRVLADYQCYPLWVVYSDGELDNIAPEVLHISSGLSESLNHWADEYDGTLNEDDPASSGFGTPGDERRFNDQGRGLAEQLAQEVGAEYKITYFDSFERKDIPISTEG